MQEPGSKAMRLTCYPTVEAPPFLRPAPTKRRWMSETPARFAYRCLPLVIANSHGWELLVDRSFTATWSGGSAAAEMRLSPADEAGSALAASHFGNGVLTFQVGYLFATEPRHSLWIMGPVNSPKDGIMPMCGVVETDWIPYTFTMNWLFTRPGTVRFESGEPFCHFFPIPRHLLTAFEPEIRDLGEEPDRAGVYSAWRVSRDASVAARSGSSTRAAGLDWDKSYVQGQSPGGEVIADQHETRLVVRPFKDLTSAPVAGAHRSLMNGVPRAACAHARTGTPRLAKAGSQESGRLVEAHILSDLSEGAEEITVTFPDPLLSASIRCGDPLSARTPLNALPPPTLLKDLDEIVQRAVLPFWSRLRDGGEANRCHLWLRRTGEHLALHLHGPVGQGPEMRRRLDEAVATGLPGRTLRWTGFRREESLAGGPLLRDSRFAGLLTACLARGCDLVLASRQPDAGKPITHGARRLPLLRALVAGPSVVGLPLETRLSYLAYHRDSLLRENLALRPGGAALQQAIAHLDRRADGFAAAVHGLAGLLAEAWTGGGDTQPAPADLGAWQRSLRDLHLYRGQLGEDVGQACGSDGIEPAFAPLFAACHGIAHQAGMNPADEAFWCHLLARAGQRHNGVGAP